MNGRERLTITLQGRKADRIPVSPFIWFNNVFEMFKYTPNIDDNFSPKDFDVVSKWVEYCRFFGFDVLFAGGFLFDSFIPGTAADWEVSISREGDADKQKRTTVVKTPGGRLSQIMNFSRTSPHLIVLAIEKFLIEEPADFELFRKYAPPAEYVDLAMISRAKKERTAFSSSLVGSACGLAESQSR